MSVALVTFNKKGTRKEFPLNSGSLVIGRKTDADLRIPLSQVSRAHCEVSIQGNAIRIRDLGSRNGTFVNDQQIAEATLHAGDRLAIGPVVFTIQIDGEPGRIEPVVPAASPQSVAEADSQTVSDAESLPVAEEVKFDIDDLSDFDLDDLSGIDLDEIGDVEEIGELEEIEDLEELDDAELIDDDSDAPPA